MFLQGQQPSYLGGATPHQGGTGVLGLITGLFRSATPIYVTDQAATPRIVSGVGAAEARVEPSCREATEAEAHDEVPTIRLIIQLESGPTDNH